MKTILAVIFWILLLTSQAFAATYYVDASQPDDLGDGLSPATAWKTVAKVNGSIFSPGDSILFNRCDTWREQLVIPSSGSRANPINFGTYGSGNLPIISGANVFNWTSEVQTNTSARVHASGTAGYVSSLSCYWRALVAAFKAGGISATFYYASTTTQPKQVFRDGSRLSLSSSKSGLGTGMWWWDAPNQRIYVYDNPTGHTIEASQRNYALTATGQSYVTVSGLQTEESQIHGVYFNGGSNITLTGIFSQLNYVDGVRFDAPSVTYVTQSTAAYNGANGFDTYSSPSIVADHCIAHDNCQLAAINWTAGFKFVDNNKAATNMTVQYSQSYNNGLPQQNYNGTIGCGVWADTVGNGFTAKYNLIYKNNNIGIFIEMDDDALVDYNLVYGNAGGIAVWGDSGNLTGAQIYNNVCYANNYSNYFGESPGIYMMGHNTAGSFTNNLVKNNISIRHTQPNLMAVQGAENDGTNGSGNIYTYNCFGPQATNFIEWGSGVYESTYADWEIAYRGSTHSVEADPPMVDPASGNFQLQPTSPCIKAGVNVGLTRDYAGTPLPKGGVPDIGAYEYTGNKGAMH